MASSPFLAQEDLATAEQAVVDAQTNTISRHELVERLGAGAGEELFERLDSAYRSGEAVIVASVREAREKFSSAAEGHARVFRARRSRGRNTDQEMVLIGMSDLEAVVKANAQDFNWLDFFAPRPDLPVPSSPLPILRGRRGRRFALR